MRTKGFFKYTLLNDLRKRIKLNAFRRKWVCQHPESELIPMNCFPGNVVEVGRYSYGELNVVTFDSKTKLKIGSFVSIAQHVTFLLDVEHYIDHLSTFPWRVKMLRESEPETFSKGNIVIDDDVWIGYGATIMSGVHIAQGAVIAAGAVVTKDVPAYAIVGGIPAKVIKFRFDTACINELEKMDFRKLTDEVIRDNLKDLYANLTCDNIRSLVANYKKDNSGIDKK